MRDREDLVTVIVCGIVFGYALSLVMLFLTHVWILDAQGRPQVEDFVAFWSAGKLALKGAPRSNTRPKRPPSATALMVRWSGSIRRSSSSWPQRSRHCPMRRLSFFGALRRLRSMRRRLRKSLVPETPGWSPARHPPCSPL
jgi:hypothetical protein